MMRSLIICIHRIFSGNKIEKNEIGGACSTYVREERFVQCFDGET